MDENEAEQPRPLGLLFARVAAQRLQLDLQRPQERLLYLPPVPLHSSMTGTVTGSYASKDDTSFNKYLLSTFYVPGAVLGAEDSLMLLRDSRWRGFHLPSFLAGFLNMTLGCISHL